MHGVGQACHRLYFREHGGLSARHTAADLGKNTCRVSKCGSACRGECTMFVRCETMLTCSAVVKADGIPALWACRRRVRGRHDRWVAFGTRVVRVGVYDTLCAYRGEPPASKCSHKASRQHPGHGHAAAIHFPQYMKRSHNTALPDPLHGHSAPVHFSQLLVVQRLQDLCLRFRSAPAPPPMPGACACACTCTCTRVGVVQHHWS